jgi:hypothetical protein
MQRITITFYDDLLAEIDAAAAEVIAPKPAKVRPRPMPRNVHPQRALDNRVVEGEPCHSRRVKPLNLESIHLDTNLEIWRPI